MPPLSREPEGVEESGLGPAVSVLQDEQVVFDFRLRKHCTGEGIANLGRGHLDS